ncbi:MAG: porin family protein [Bacteroidales bacterium]|nr:porin family protein [Bacteroidales bacterium]MCM1148119.1 porin family protein [Bacteroidales bacterium]MCM1206535.1 porin family protein [Bacillota bacterium]MCM1510563.1 porin family protein [Clostridium sp.]
MKKIFMIAVMAVAALSANAQIWVGGNLGFNTQKATVKVDNVSVDNTSTSFSIAPEIGYNLNDDWAVAVRLGYEHNPSFAMSIGDESFSGRTNSFEINPYVRYKVVKTGKFYAFIDGGLAFGTTHVNGTSDYMDNINAFRIGFNPGVAYNVTPKVTLVAHIGDLSYTTAWTKVKDGREEAKISSNAFNLNLTNSISFGAYVNF